MDEYGDLINKMLMAIEDEANSIARDNGSKIRSFESYVHNAGRSTGMRESAQIIRRELKKAVEAD